MGKPIRKPRKRGALYRDQLFPPLSEITRPTIPTNDAAHYLNKKPGTLRMWHSLGRGPIRPIVVYGKLNWFVAEIRSLVTK